MNFSRTLLICLTVIILILDLCYCDDIDRTFFKKKKEKKKEKKPSYKPYNERTFHKKNKEKVKKPSYHAPPHKPSYHPGNHPGDRYNFMKDILTFHVEEDQFLSPSRQPDTLEPQ